MAADALSSSRRTDTPVDPELFRRDGRQDARPGLPRIRQRPAAAVISRGKYRRHAALLLPLDAGSPLGSDALLLRKATERGLG